jgi:PHD/YefM family antitoxin component YafN of YafNO toxin-antitoxin module
LQFLIAVPEPLDTLDCHGHTAVEREIPMTLRRPPVDSKYAPLRSSPALQRVPISQARLKLGALATRVRRNKDYIILEKDGVAIAGVMDIDEFEDYLELRDPKVRAHIRQSNKEYLAGKSRSAAEFAGELRREARQKIRRRSRA